MTEQDEQIKTEEMLVALGSVAAPAAALDYDCSPITGGCTPRASQPSAFDAPYPPVVYVPPLPRTCPLDGPGAWSCERRDRGDRRR
jgi:hypothetical protein